MPPSLAPAVTLAVATLLLRSALAAAGEQFVRRFDWEVGTAVLEERLLSYVTDPDRFRQEPAPEGEQVVLW